MVKNQRILEKEERKGQYLWGSLPPGVNYLPGFIHAPTRGDLPRDAQFSDEESRSFHHGRLHGMINLGLSYLRIIFVSWDSFENFQRVFTGWTGDTPKISQNDLWMEDRMFGYQFLTAAIHELLNDVTSSQPTSLFQKKWLQRFSTEE